ncbi:MAG: polyprenol monophosphomannose synthase [Candidatus Altiarchaeota archaeon]
MARVSLIVPTYNEGENIKTLADGVFKVVGKSNLDLELVVVDDNSPDGTAKAAEELGREYPIKVFCRTKERGLSSAVPEGFKHAGGDVLGVMDADLSHPPEKIPEMIGALGKADIVVGSRLIEGGGVEDWPLSRKLISEGATLLARPLTSVSDPMSGFFFMKKTVIEGVKMNPMGYKILLEILVKGKYKNVAEVPFLFLNRKVGKSKLNMRIQMQYLMHLLRLYLYKVLG